MAPAQINCHSVCVLLKYRDTCIIIKATLSKMPLMENRSARLTILVDPRKKKLFEEICAGHDLTPSQVIRRMMRQYIIEHAGNRELPDWLTSASPKKPPG